VAASSARSTFRSSTIAEAKHNRTDERKDGSDKPKGDVGCPGGVMINDGCFHLNTSGRRRVCECPTVDRQTCPTGAEPGVADGAAPPSAMSDPASFSTPM
jgi:hypothetical protein